MTDRKHIGQTSFAVSARVAMQLGRESISSSIVAVLELVKNAYDADAENVSVKFSGLSTPNAVLVIEDDGIGMDRMGLESNWMVIGTDSKRNSFRSSKKKRTLTGEKGLGRLGLDRLCNVTIIQTYTETESQGIELEIEWKKYENTSERLERITHSVYEIPKEVLYPTADEPIFKEHGTRLILQGLKDNWTREYLQMLYQELSLLVSPFGDVNNFSIFFDTSLNLPELDGRVRSIESLTAAEWHLRSQIYQDQGKFYVRHKMTSPLYEAVFEFGPRLWVEMFPESRSEVPKCGPLEFQLYFFRNPVDETSLTGSQLRTFLHANQGIRMYRDGFRVSPYGDPSGEGDWLSLGLRRTRNPGGVKKRPIGSWKVGYNQVVGAVFIGREENPELIDQTNREGIVEGPAYWDLRRFALHGVEFFERSRQSFELARPDIGSYEQARDDAQKTADVTVNAAGQLKSLVDQASGLLVEIQSAPESEEAQQFFSKLSDIADEIQKATIESRLAQETLLRASEEEREELQRQKDTLGNLASLGILAAAFGHETLAAANLVHNNARLLDTNIRGLLFPQPDLHHRIQENVEYISSGADKIETFAKFTLANVSRDKRKRVKLDLGRIAQDVMASFSKSLQVERGIEIELKTQKDVPPVLGFRIDWESIIVNFIVNAIWATEDTPRDQRRIRIEIYADSEILHFNFSDSGRGIEPGTEDLIFLPTFSTRRNEKGDVIGTGMGLAIIKTLIETSHGGNIEAISPCDLGGAEFRIQIPIPKLAERGVRK